MRLVARECIDCWSPLVGGEGPRCMGCQDARDANEEVAEPFRRMLREGSLTHPGHPWSCTCGCQEESR